MNKSFRSENTALPCGRINTSQYVTGVFMEANQCTHWKNPPTLHRKILKTKILDGCRVFQQQLNSSLARKRLESQGCRF